MRGFRDCVRGRQGKYHGTESKFLSKYALPPSTAPSLYKQGLGHSVSIRGDHPSFLCLGIIKDSGTSTSTEHNLQPGTSLTLPTCQLDAHARCLFKRLSGTEK